MRPPVRAGLAVAAAASVLALGAALASPSAPAWRLPVPATSSYRPAPLSPGDRLREAYAVRLNGSRMDFARFASSEPPSRVLARIPRTRAPVEGQGTAEAVLVHGDGFGGAITWRSRAPLIPLAPACAGDCPGPDPGGIRPPSSRRLLAAGTDRADALSAALYEAGPAAAPALAARLVAEGWGCLDAGGGLGLWRRGDETLLLDAPCPGRPGISLVYWRAP